MMITNPINVRLQAIVPASDNKSIYISVVCHMKKGLISFVRELQRPE